MLDSNIGTIVGYHISNPIIPKLSHPRKGHNKRAGMRAVAANGTAYREDKAIVQFYLRLVGQTRNCDDEFKDEPRRPQRPRGQD